MTYKKTATILLVASVCVIAAFAFGGYLIVRAFTGVSIDENTLYQVADVKDGDTFDIKIGRHTITVRMLGIDTPETVDPRKPVQCYGKEASEETKRLLAGQSVRLRLNPNREEKDRYGRYLAYAYRVDGLFINSLLIENGFAREYTFGEPYIMQKTFKRLEWKAEKEQRGLWKDCNNHLQAAGTEKSYP